MIGGNIKATVQIKSTVDNIIGESEVIWTSAFILEGWLDLSSGDAPIKYNAKLEESTHVFICDFFDYRSINMTPENSRLMIDGRIYNITLIDDPMELHQHIEITLNFIGGGLNG